MSITKYNGTSRGIDNADICNIIENYLIPAVQGSGSANPQLTDILNQLISFTQQEQFNDGVQINSTLSIENNTYNSLINLNNIEGNTTGTNALLNTVITELQMLNNNFSAYANAYATRFIVHNGNDAVATHNV